MTERRATHPGHSRTGTDDHGPAPLGLRVVAFVTLVAFAAGLLGSVVNDEALAHAGEAVFALGFIVTAGVSMWRMWRRKRSGGRSRS